MDEQNKIEKLMEKAEVSYEDAVSVLEVSDWDVLNAMILLEKQNSLVNSACYCTKTDEIKQNACGPCSDNRKYGFIIHLYRWFCMVIKKGNSSRVEIIRKDRTLLSLPVTVSLIILLVTIRETPIIIVISLFFGCKYYIKANIKLEKEKQ